MAVEVGQSASISRVVTGSDVAAFAELTLDRNPIHLDEEYAASTIFGQRIAHGMIVAALISAVLGTKLPGPGCIYLEQELRFTAPVFFGDFLTASCTVTELGQGNRCTMATEVVNGDGIVVVSGAALLVLPREAK